MAGSNATLGDVVVDRIFVANQITLPASQITNVHIQAASGVDASKLDHQHARGYGTGSATTAATARQVLFIARAAGTVRELVATLVDACAGAATVEVDLLKNGVTICTTTITFDNADADYAVLAAVLDAAEVDFVADDVFEIDVTATAGGGTLGKGIAAEVHFDTEYV